MKQVAMILCLLSILLVVGCDVTFEKKLSRKQCNDIINEATNISFADGYNEGGQVGYDQGFNDGINQMGISISNQISTQGFVQISYGELERPLILFPYYGPLNGTEVE